MCSVAYTHCGTIQVLCTHGLMLGRPSICLSLDLFGKPIQVNSWADCLLSSLPTHQEASLWCELQAEMGGDAASAPPAVQPAQPAPAAKPARPQQQRAPPAADSRPAAPAAAPAAATHKMHHSPVHHPGHGHAPQQTPAGKPWRRVASFISWCGLQTMLRCKSARVLRRLLRGLMLVCQPWWMPSGTQDAADASTGVYMQFADPEPANEALLRPKCAPQSHASTCRALCCCCAASGLVNQDPAWKCVSSLVVACRSAVQRTPEFTTAAYPARERGCACWLLMLLQADAAADALQTLGPLMRTLPPTRPSSKPGRPPLAPVIQTWLSL